MSDAPTPAESLPSRFGPFGGCFVPEVLRPALEELAAAYEKYRHDEELNAEIDRYARTYVGRPTPLHHARNLSRELGGATVWVKLEGLAHTGAHKINNAIGQALLAKRMGKTRIIAETGAGQHGVATATAAAVLGLECEIFMGAVDAARQVPNRFWMETMGASFRVVEEGTATLKDAVNAAMRHWTERIEDTHYLLGSALGPHPYPTMVRDFQSVIGRELRAQLDEAGVTPHTIVACVGGGSNGIGAFHEFLDDEVKLVGVEAGGRGPGSGENAVRMSGLGRPGIVQAYRSLFLQDDDGQVLHTHSVSAGLDYPGIGPELAWLGQEGRIDFASATDAETLDALRLLARTEGLIAALESAHAVARVARVAPTLSPDDHIVVNLSGRGDKDLFIVARELDREPWRDFLRDEIERLDGGNGGDR